SLEVCSFMILFSPSGSQALDDGGDPHATAHAEGAQSVLLVTAFQLIQHGAHDHGTGGPQRVAHGDGTAVDVHFVVTQAHVLHETHGHGGEGLVDFHQVDLIDGHAGFLQYLAAGRRRASEHDGGISAADGGGHHPPTRRH